MVVKGNTLMDMVGNIPIDMEMVIMVTNMTRTMEAIMKMQCSIRRLGSTQISLVIEESQGYVVRSCRKINTQDATF